MALESVSVAETLIQSNNDNDDDLEDGEIPSDEDDEPIPPVVATPIVESPKAVVKPDVSKKSFDNKFNKNKKSSSQGSTGNSNSSGSKHDRFLKYKSPSEDWAGDVEKAIRAALEEDGSRNSESKTKNKNSRNKSRKRSRDDKDEERSKDQKRRKPSEDDNTNEDEDEMLFVRGASPVKKELPPDNDNSPTRRSNDHDNHDSSSDYDDRPSVNRHRDNEKRNNGRGAGRRGGKNERGGKNKGRGQIRNDRSGRRNQQLDSDSENICVYYMQGKCHRGDDCPYSHDALPPRKMELCKFYLMDCCAKRDKCLYMHHDFPCKYFHTGLKCNAGKNCKFSHQPLNEQVKGILLKHLETAPKEILGDFPRLGREGAMLMIDNTARTLAQGQDATTQKIPSLFELNLQAPMNIMNKNDDKDERVAPMDDVASNQQKSSRKPSGKKTRWGSDEDRVPYEQVMLLQSANEFGLQLPNAALGLASGQQLPHQQQQQLQPPPVLGMDFYTESTKSNETGGNKFKENQDFTKDVEEDEILAQAKKKTSVFEYTKDVDLRQLLKAKKNPPPVVSIADEVANLTKKSNEEESDQDEESDLVIEVPGEEDEKDKIVQSEESNKDVEMMNSSSQSLSTTTAMTEEQDIPSHLPKKAQELFMRIQQQQRAAQDSFKNMEDDNNTTHVLEPSTEDWYSDDDDDDDEEDCGLTIDIPGKDASKEESELNEKSQNDVIEPKEEEQPIIPTPSIPQPAAIVDKLGDLSKIDISAEVSKLLSSLKAQSSTNGKVLKNPQQSGINNNGNSNNITSTTIQQQQSSVSKVQQQQSSPNTNNLSDDYSIMNKMINNSVSQASKLEGENLSPRSSPGLNSATMPVSRDPRMSRDPRQRRDEQKLGSPSRTTVETKKETKHLRLETSIYSSGIIAIDSNMDTDLRTTTDQDLRRKDMDFRQSFQTGFGDTDLRVVNTFAEPSTKSDVDLRQMLSLPFKPVPSHIPCTEIDASIASHPPIVYRVYVVDIPRPDYTGLKLTKNDPQVKYDPRLRKIFRINKTDLTDSPMSPPPMKLDTPKSPPLIRSDPRRKALEVNSTQKSSASMIQVPQQSVVEMSKMGMCPGMPTGPPQTMPTPQGMMGMGGNPMLGNMGPMGSMMNTPMNPSNIPSMGMTGMPNVTPPMPMNGPPVMSSNQMNFDPRFNAQRNNGAGLLGPAPGVGFGPEIPNSYDGGPGPYPGGNFNNFGPGPSDPGMMGFNPNNGPNAPPNFGMDGPPDWNPGNQNRRGGGGRARRRNRNRTNVANN